MEIVLENHFHAKLPFVAVVGCKAHFGGGGAVVVVMVVLELVDVGVRGVVVGLLLLPGAGRLVVRLVVVVVVVVVGDVVVVDGAFPSFSSTRFPLSHTSMVVRPFASVNTTYVVCTQN